MREAALLILIALVASPIVGFLFAPLWAKKLTADLDQVIERARQVSRGDTFESWPKGNIVEYNDLSNNLEAMSEALTDRERKLQALNEDLESRIFERTRELSDSRQKLQMILDTSPLGIGIISEGDGKLPLRQSNAELGNMLGVSVDELIGGSAARFWKRPELRDVIVQRALDGDMIEDLEIEMVRADGTPMTGLLTMRPTPYADERALIFWLYDISVQKDAQERLEQALSELQSTQQSLVEAEKMASLGNLVAGIAHEINTPVGIGITAMSHFREVVADMRKKYESKTFTRSSLESFFEPADESAKIAFSNLERAANLVKSFKQVAVDQTNEQRRVFWLGEYLDEVLVSLKPQLKRSRVEVSVDCDPDIQINSYPGDIAQIITNLVMNSLKHGYGDGDEGQIRISVSHTDRIKLVYSDDGRGMDAATLASVFEPFFTTKRGEGGTGLGMNIVFNLVAQRLGGRIECASAVGEGVTFTLAFPREAPMPPVAHAV